MSYNELMLELAVVRAGKFTDITTTSSNYFKFLFNGQTTVRLTMRTFLASLVRDFENILSCYCTVSYCT